jgi:hypothetical protein
MEAHFDRRGFVGALLVLPFGTFLLQCGSEKYGDNPAAAPQRSGTQTVYTSSEVNEHFHTYTMQDSVLTAGAAVDTFTTSSGGHSHPLQISAAQLQSVASGQTVKVTTQSAEGHTHVFTLVKVA